MSWQYEGIQSYDASALSFRNFMGNYRPSDYVWVNYDEYGYAFERATLPVNEMPDDWFPGNNPPASARVERP